MQRERMRQMEWLETDGLGGFASGTVAGVRTRRYHALLVAATTPPTGRVALVSGYEAWAETPAGVFALSSQSYAPGVVYPDGYRRVVSFQQDPWPQWVFKLEDGTEIGQALFMRHGAPVTVVRWRLVRPRSDVALLVRPFIAGRDYHGIHRENAVFQFEPVRHEGLLCWQPYAGLPQIVMAADAPYAHDPHWYRNFLYEAERDRGLEHIEDLASPGCFRWDLSGGEAVWIVAAQHGGARQLPALVPAGVSGTALEAAEGERRSRLASSLHRAAQAYVVQVDRPAGSGRRDGEAGGTMIAGYPWFTDWGRDTFVAMRGLCLATGSLEVARTILLEWTSTISEGMVPNRFADVGVHPEYNAVDASLWYIIAVHEFLSLSSSRGLAHYDRDLLQDAIQAILSGYARGTRYGIRLDADGLLAAGEAGVPLTWMDARVNDRAVTPRIGKPVEVQALWLNALKIGGLVSGRWRTCFAQGRKAFEERFWNATAGYLYDVVDCEHEPGTVDPSFRPNQILAIGGLPWPVLTGPQARRVVEAVERRLWTPMGLRSLAPEERGYVAVYGGGAAERDAAYHQGTVWPWLAGPFVEAWVRVHRSTEAVKRQAYRRYLEPLLKHLDEAGLGHVSEITDAEPPFTPRGCPFQAWSLGEVLRLLLVVLANGRDGGKGTPPSPRSPS